jgi:translocator protein
LAGSNILKYFMEKSRLMLGSKLLFSLVICQFAVVFGQVVSGSQVESWYMSLQKPFFTVPTWLFLPLRSIVLFLLGIALFFVLVQIDKFDKVKKVLTLYIIQIVLNILLNIVFFGFHSMLAGAAVSVVSLIFAIAITKKSFHISEVAGILTIPYIFGISYTLIFDLTLLIMNR